MTGKSYIKKSLNNVVDNSPMEIKNEQGHFGRTELPQSSFLLFDNYERSQSTKKVELLNKHGHI